MWTRLITLLQDLLRGFPSPEELDEYHHVLECCCQDGKQAKIVVQKKERK